MGWVGNRRFAFDVCWLVACLAVSSAWCISAAGQLSATFDEPLYVATGLERWHTGSHRELMRMGTMPLPVDVTTLPLYLWEQWRGAPFDAVADLDQLLPWARALALVFWWTLLLYGWLAARQLAGAWGGRVAVAWLACEPNLLAHASLATTDVAICACVLALAYHFRKGRERGWWLRVGVPACWFAAAVLAKASGMVFGPLCLLVIEVERLARAGAFRPNPPGNTGTAGCSRCSWSAWRAAYDRLAPLRRDLLAIMAVGFPLVFLYCGCDWRPEPSFVEWAHGRPEGPAKSVMVWIADNLRIFSNAGEGLVRQIRHNMQGHGGAYLLGAVHTDPVWYYFPVALCIKLTVPLLAAPLVVAGLRRQALFNWACLTALVLLAFSVNCRVQIGIRLVLPLVVMLVVGLASAMVQAVRTSESSWRRRLLAASAGVGLAWTAWSSAHVWPNGLCYTNELWGGTERGYLCLSDSNYDWGQGAKELARWQREQGLSQLDVWYFGSDPVVGPPPLREVPLHVLPIERPDDVRAFVQGDYLAVGTTLLYGTIHEDTAPVHHRAAEYLRRQTPVDRTTTFLIYRLSEPAAGGAGGQTAGRTAADDRSRQ